MNKTLIAALIVSVGLGSQAFAQKVKQGNITFSLTRQYQLSTNLTLSGGEPTKWQAKTKTAKVTQASILSAIGAVIHRGFSSKATLTLARPELSGYYGGDRENSLVQLPEGQNSFPAPGLFQPAGQIFAKDGTYCTNVTSFFRIKVQECYDCFYLDSFVTDSTFSRKASDAPPCCSPAFTASGSGKDKYYMAFSFDNTINNGMLISADGTPVITTSSTIVTNVSFTTNVSEVIDDKVDPPVTNLVTNIIDNTFYVTNTVFVTNTVYAPIGLDPHDNGIVPDDETGYAAFDVLVGRFTIQGIVTYSWSFKEMNKGAGDNDFIGTATMSGATGYGFIAKTCCLLTGSMSIAEKLFDASACCFVLGDEIPLADVPHEDVRVDWNQDGATTNP